MDDHHAIGICFKLWFWYQRHLYCVRLWSAWVNPSVIWKEGGIMLLQLLISFLKIGAFSFGGGYAALPLIQNEVVNIHQWISMTEFTNLVTISQMTPGPIAINTATFVGMKVSGVLGAIIATLGCVLPSCIIVTMLAWLYLKYRQLDTLQSVLKTLRPAVVAMIAAAGVSMMITSFWGDVISIETTKVSAICLFGISIYLLAKKEMSPVLVMSIAGVLNLIQNLIMQALV